MSFTPPIDRWSRDVVEREIVRLARDLPELDADEARRRLRRLTARQREALEQMLRRMGGLRGGP